MKTRVQPRSQNPLSHHSSTSTRRLGPPFASFGRWLALALVAGFTLAAQAQTTATATAIVSYGFVVSYTVTGGGSGYTEPPVVTVLGGGGTGATAVARVANGVVTQINVVATGSGYTSPPEVVISAPPQPTMLTIQMIPLLTIHGLPGDINQIETSTSLSAGAVWVPLTTVVLTSTVLEWYDRISPPSPGRFYRVLVLGTNSPLPSGMALIPAGNFTMGNCMDPGEGNSDELPLHTVYVSAFYLDKADVTKSLWDGVYNWATNHGYSFEYGAQGKGTNHPAYSVTWYDAVKWCNARSQKEGRTPAYYTSAAQTTVYRSGQTDVQTNCVKWSSGYRLPTEAEWEKAARGGLSGQRFPWGDTISGSQANYIGNTAIYSYDLGPDGDNATFATGGYPYTSPAGYFAANGYGLYDMAGNVFEWCWDWYGGYSSGSQTDPRGPASGYYRVRRGGSWDNYAFRCRSARRDFHYPTGSPYFGFRPVLPPGQ